VEPDVVAVAEQQTIPTPVSNSDADVVADDRSRGGRHDDSGDVEVVGRPGIERRGDEHGLARERDAETLDAHEPEDGRVAELAEEAIDEAGRKKHCRVNPYAEPLEAPAEYTTQP